MPWEAEIAKVPIVALDGKVAGIRRGMQWHGDRVDVAIRFSQRNAPGATPTTPFSPSSLLTPLPSAFLEQSATVARYRELHERHAKRKAELADIADDLARLAVKESAVVLAADPKKEDAHFARKQHLEDKRTATEAAVAVLGQELHNAWKAIEREAVAFMNKRGEELFQEKTARVEAILAKLAEHGDLIRELAEVDAVISVLRKRMDPATAGPFLLRDLPQPPAPPKPKPALATAS
jgi:hypothetical protein